MIGSRSVPTWRWHHRLSRLELTICGALVSLILAVFLERALHYMELAERTAVEVTVGNVNSALNVGRALEMLRRQAPSGPSASLRNPFDFAGMSPPNFHGEFDSPDLAAYERGNWVFDRTKAELIYLPRLTRGLSTKDPDRAIRFRLEAGRQGALELVPTSTYSWN
jgi:hypothetical protein